MHWLLILFEHLVVAFYLFLVRVDILDYIDTSTIQLRNVYVCLTAACTMHVLPTRRILMLLIDLLLRAIHLFDNTEIDHYIIYNLNLIL